MSAIDRERERIYRKHNITRTARKMVPDDNDKPTPVARPNNPDQQCNCDDCRGHRKANAVTGIATAKKDI